MKAPYPVLPVDNWQVAGTETSGGDEKEWLEDPFGSLWLFKPRTEHVDWAQGEHWAEKVTSELGERLQIPAARVELAVRDGRVGSVSLSLRPPGVELQHGALLLAELIPGYVPRAKNRGGHNLENIDRVLRNVQPPEQLSEMTAFEAFAGFLVLDALVANQDRHDENWAVLRPLPGRGPVALAGSYDHGSSLGFNLTDGKRMLELRRDGVAAFAARATAQRFDRSSDGQLSLVELANSALSRCSPTARHHWLTAVRDLEEVELEETVDRVPELSDPTRTFTRVLLAINRRRLLDEH